MTMKPNYGQPIVRTTGPAYGAERADFTAGFVQMIRTTGPRFGARRIRDTGAYGAPRLENTTA